MKNVTKVALIFIFTLFTVNTLYAQAPSSAQPGIESKALITVDALTPSQQDSAAKQVSIDSTQGIIARVSTSRTLHKMAVRKEERSLLVVFLIALFGGLLTVFTPYVYAFVPMTVSTLVFRSDTRAEGNRHILYFSLFIIVIFTTLGGLITVIFGSTGLSELTNNWIFNLFFCRFLAGLGLSMLGAFELSLPMAIIRATHSKARSVSTSGLFFMALTLPVVTFSSTFPLVGLILVLASKASVGGPVAGMFGFSIGISAPFWYTRIINLMPASVLNYIKVLMGFILIFLGIKFFSNADVARGWHILDRDMFLLIWILLSVMLGAYMLGWVKFTNDYVPQQNIYGQEYVSLVRLFIVIAAFTLAIYLLPGLWGAPLKGLGEFLPPA